MLGAADGLLWLAEAREKRREGRAAARRAHPVPVDDVPLEVPFPHPVPAEVVQLQIKRALPVRRERPVGPDDVGGPARLLALPLAVEPLPREQGRVGATGSRAWVFSATSECLAADTRQRSERDMKEAS